MNKIKIMKNYDELKNHTEKLYKTYVKKDIKPVEMDPEIKAEYISQKKYLEKSVAMLNKNLKKDREIHKQDNIRIMSENVELIREINNLRKTIKNKFNSKTSEGNDKNLINFLEKEDLLGKDDVFKEEKLSKFF